MPYAAEPALVQELLTVVADLRKRYPERSSDAQLPLTASTFGDREVTAALETLIAGPVTMGPRVADFEAAFARAMGSRRAVFCNSGSSANLLAIAALTRAPGADGKPVLSPGDEVIVPAVTWSTTLWPVVQVGAVPVLVDVSPRTLNLTVESVQAAITPRTKALFVVHLLGNPAPMADLQRLCDAQGIALLEDSCEALDTEAPDRRAEVRKAGTFGRFGTYSFYFSHHICTIEGGMVVCDDPADADLLTVLRSHGWTRQLSTPARETAEAANPDVDPRFLFIDIGYNLRGTDLQAAIGLVQLERRLGFLERRREVAAAWHRTRSRLNGVFGPIDFAAGASHFAFPLVLRRDAPTDRAELFAFLADRGVDTRPLVAGNLARQPGLQRFEHRVAGPLPGADLLHERGMYVGIHPNLTDRQVAAFQVILEDFADH